MPVACQCSEFNPACTRAGPQGMTRRRWELCAGVNCTSEQSAAYRAKWDGEAEAAQPRLPPPVRKSRTDCIHLGVVTDRTGDDGKPCHCPKKWKRACEIHGTTTLNQCKTCKDFDADEPKPERVGILRNLLFHVYPRKGNGIWQANLEQLRQRIKLFNGRRVIAVAADATTDSPDAVKEFMAGCNIEWIVQRNSKIREVATWHSLWTRVQGQHDLAVTFYGHAKGVTRPVNVGVTVHPWARMLYHVNLDYWPLVEEMLQTHPIAGAFRKRGHGFLGSASSWHYSGTFYWLRNRDVFARDWTRIDKVWWGTESWPGIHFKQEEAACLFHDGVVPTLNLYDMKYLKGVVEPALEQWKSEKRRYLAPVTG